MNSISCPFCGLATGLPHNSQESCIAALHQEIARMRSVLESARPPGDARAVTVEPAAHAENERENEPEPA